jgi:integrase/recombinase XerD
MGRLLAAEAPAPAPIPAVGVSLASAVELFLTHCRFEKKLSVKTLVAYRLDLRQLTDFIDDPAAPALVDRSLIKQYLRELNQRFAEKSVKRKTATLKALYTFLEREDHIEVSPFRKLDYRVKATTTLPRAISSLSVDGMLAAAYAGVRRGRLGFERVAGLNVARDVAVIEMLFHTGVRVSELCALQLPDVDLVDGAARVMGKGSRERVVPLTDAEVLAALQRYRALRAADPRARDHAAFFINHAGRPMRDHTARTIVAAVAAEAGIETRVTPHVLRHSTATLLLEEGVDIRYIQQLLGHSSILVTQTYAQVNNVAQRRVLAERHPRLRMPRAHAAAASAG